MIGGDIVVVVMCRCDKANAVTQKRVYPWSVVPIATRQATIVANTSNDIVESDDGFGTGAAIVAFDCHVHTSSF